jgi:hypothetical protein
VSLPVSQKVVQAGPKPSWDRRGRAWSGLEGNANQVYEKPEAEETASQELAMAKDFYSKYAWASILFGVGAFFILTFLFFPMTV